MFPAVHGTSGQWKVDADVPAERAANGFANSSRLNCAGEDSMRNRRRVSISASQVFSFLFVMTCVFYLDSRNSEFRKRRMEIWMRISLANDSKLNLAGLFRPVEST